MKFSHRVKRLERAANVGVRCALCGQAGAGAAGEGTERMQGSTPTARSPVCPRCGAGVSATTGQQRTAALPPLDELPFSLRWLLGLERGGTGGLP